MVKILNVQSSARSTGSASRALTDKILARFPGAEVVHRDLAQGPLAQVDEAWVAANFTPEADRTDAQKKILAKSDELIAELKAADVIILGVPIYNFNVPAAMKAWIDLVARAGVTFKYGPTGPVGLVEGKRVIIAVASGGTAIGSEMDFASGYLRKMLAFLGMTNVDIVAAARTAMDAKGALEEGISQVEALKL